METGDEMDGKVTGEKGGVKGFKKRKCTGQTEQRRQTNTQQQQLLTNHCSSVVCSGDCTESLLASGVPEHLAIDFSVYGITFHTHYHLLLLLTPTPILPSHPTPPPPLTIFGA